MMFWLPQRKNGMDMVRSCPLAPDHDHQQPDNTSQIVAYYEMLQVVFHVYGTWLDQDMKYSFTFHP